VQASTRSQKYLGYQYRDGNRRLAGESESSRQIAAATRGQICQYRGKIFCTYYSAVCGGRTVRGAEVFADAAPLLTSVPCDHCREARLYRWSTELSKGEFQQEIAPWFKEQEKVAGPVKAVSLVRRSAAEKSLPEFEIRTGAQTVRMSGGDLRPLLSDRGVYSPQFSIVDRGSTLEIQGRGHGHGVGLCQWGARGLALEGKSYREILQYYYPGLSLATHIWK
jgi:stage II sporulation protein D